MSTSDVRFTAARLLDDDHVSIVDVIDSKIIHLFTSALSDFIFRAGAFVRRTYEVGSRRAM
jgi:hypothetical protein